MTGTQTTTNNAEPNPHASQADPITNLFVNGSRCPVHTTPAGPGVAVYDTPALTGTATMIGGTKVTVDYHASTATGVQLNARMYDIFPDNTQVLVDRGPYRVTSADGPATFELHGNGWRFEPGHKIRIELAQDDAGYLKVSEVVSTIDITNVKLKIPVREPQPPLREDYHSSFDFCRAERAFLGDAAFNEKYHSWHWALSFWRCVWENH